MGTYRAKKRGSLIVEGVTIPFDKGLNVTPLADQIPAAILKGLVAESIWEDVSAEIIETEQQMSLNLKKVEAARKAKVKK